VGWLGQVDAAIALWFHAHATPWLTPLVLAVSSLHDPLPMTAVVIVLATGLALKKRWLWLGCLVATVPFGMLLNLLMKHAVQRARPRFDDPILTLPTYSFPSGHVVGATLLYGLFAAMLWTWARTWRQRGAVVLAALAMVVLVAMTRLYLGVHYLSDVLAAFAEGVAWLALCLTGLRPFRNLRGP
jgi:undecaprenyl-diphosphatase